MSSKQPLTIEPGKWYVCRDENQLAYIVFAPFDGRPLAWQAACDVSRLRVD